MGLIATLSEIGVVKGERYSKVLFLGMSYLISQEAEADLRAVLPALEEAERGLNSLKKADLLEIRSVYSSYDVHTESMID